MNYIDKYHKSTIRWEIKKSIRIRRPKHRKISTMSKKEHRQQKRKERRKKRRRQWENSNLKLLFDTLSLINIFKK